MPGDLAARLSLWVSSYEPVIGLEVHCQLNTQTKLFSPDRYEFGMPANTQAGPVTLGLPGVLPVLNEEVLDLAIMAGIALECEIAEITKFDRKHYYYPDLPKGYQISQYDIPYCTRGMIRFYKKGDEEPTLIRVHRIHMEEDAGKLLHSHHADAKTSYVDLNRAGVPLLEIVSEADIRSSEDAYWYLHTLRNILRYIDVTDGNMEEGSLRCDANISVRKGPDAAFGTRVEIKNLNSFKAVRAAIDYEIERQIDVIEAGGKIIQSTVLWDADKRETRLMRTKEDAEDYRYFPDPDLNAFYIDRARVESIRKKMPELPDDKRNRYIKEYGLPIYDAEVLTREKETAAYFEQVVQVSEDAKKSSNWVKDEVLGILNKNDISFKNFACTADRLGRMIVLLNEEKLTSKMAKRVFEHIYTEDMDPEDVIEKYDLKPMDTSGLPEMVARIMAENEENIQKIMDGNERVKGHLVGQVMKVTRGQAPPQMVNQLINAELEKRR